MHVSPINQPIGGVGKNYESSSLPGSPSNTFRARFAGEVAWCLVKRQAPAWDGVQNRVEARQWRDGVGIYGTSELSPPTEEARERRANEGEDGRLKLKWERGGG